MTDNQVRKDYERKEVSKSDDFIAKTLSYPNPTDDGRPNGSLPLSKRPKDE